MGYTDEYVLTRWRRFNGRQKRKCRWIFAGIGGFDLEQCKKAMGKDEQHSHGHSHDDHEHDTSLHDAMVESGRLRNDSHHLHSGGGDSHGHCDDAAIESGEVIATTLRTRTHGHTRTTTMPSVLFLSSWMETSIWIKLMTGSAFC